MGAKKISALAAASLALTGAEVLPAVQSGATVRLTVDQLLATPMAFQPSGPENTLASRLGYVLNVLDFPGATFAAQLQAAHDAAALLGGGRIFIPPGSYAINSTTSGTIALTGSNIEIFSARGAAHITFSGTGPHITVGGTTLKASDITLRGVYLTGALGQVLIQTKYHRGLRFYGVKTEADGMFVLGDSALDTAHGSYVVELYDGCEMNQLASPTRHFVHCKNFIGQWVNFGSFIEGVFASNIHGFYVADNIQTHVDDMHTMLGYFSRFDRNYDFTDGRVTNCKFVMHHSEGALTHAVHIEISSSTSKDKTKVGAEGVSIVGGRWNAAGNHFYIGHNRNESGVEVIGLINIYAAQLTGGSSAITTPILIESTTATSVVRQVQIIGLNGYFNATDTSQDMVKLKGGTTAGALADIVVDDITGWSSNGNALRSVVRVEGSGNTRVSVGGNIRGRNVTKLVDDQSGVLIRNGKLYRTGSTGFSTVAANTEGSAATLAASGAKVGDPVRGVITSGTRPAGLQFRFDVLIDDVVSVTPINCTASSISSGTIGTIGFDLWVDIDKH